MKGTVFIRIEESGAKTKFLGVPLFQKSKNQCVIGAAHKEDLNYEIMSNWVQDIYILRYFCRPEVSYRILKKHKCQKINKCQSLKKLLNLFPSKNRGAYIREGALVSHCNSWILSLLKNS